jgi:hypothetical protein
MAEYPATGSTLESTPPTPHAGLSTQIVVKVGPTAVGAIQELTLNQNRDMLIWEEIGTDGIVEIHPKGAAKISMTINRVVFDQLRLPEAFSRGFINLQAQRLPFNIEVLDRFAGSNELAAVHTYHSCWFRRYTQPYRAESFLITETAELVCEYISSMQAGVNVAQGGIRDIIVESDSMERATDRTGRRGRIERVVATSQA